MQLIPCFYITRLKVKHRHQKKRSGNKFQSTYQSKNQLTI